MFRSLHMKLVLIMMLLVVSVMAVVGTFLINSVTSFYIDEFLNQVDLAFKPGTQMELREVAEQYEDGKGGGARALWERVQIHTNALGLGRSRTCSILSAETGEFLTGYNETVGREFKRTPNIITAMTGELGKTISPIKEYMDVAIPIDGGDGYIVYIRDEKKEMQNLTQMLFAIIMQSMLFGLIVAVFLSFTLSKTMTSPIESLKKGAQRVAQGDFEHKLEVQSSDEIGELTHTFNNMAEVLRHTLEEVQGERDKLNTLFSHMTDGVAAFTPAGKIIHMNFATEKLLGIAFREDMTFNEVFTGMKLPKESETGKKGYVQSEIVRKGRALTVLFAPYGAVDGDGGIMAVIHDVTEQRKLDDARREFVANVSHELRTPLTNIKSYTETLIDAAGDLPPETSVRFLNVVSSEADRMTRIVKDLLTLSKLDYGKMDMKFSHFSIKKLLETVFEAMRLEACNKNLEFSLNVRADLPEMNGDKERLEQVVVNILSNAVKYTPSGGRVELIAAMRDSQHIFIKVRDNGIGIPQEDQPRLFERFYRVDKARSRAAGGTGLGLAIAKEIVEIHKGTIFMESSTDVGTTFTIVLPVNLPLPDKEESRAR